MEFLIPLVVAVGAWLLVAGPMYQAAIELTEEEVDREAIGAIAENAGPAPHISPAWWLLPPVAWMKQRRLTSRHRDGIMNQLSDVQRKQAISFFSKATGWMTVAVGAFLIAIGETWHLIEDIHFPFWSFWVVVVLAAIACVTNTAVRMHSHAEQLGIEQPLPQNPQQREREIERRRLRAEKKARKTQ